VVKIPSFTRRDGAVVDENRDGRTSADTAVIPDRGSADRASAAGRVDDRRVDERRPAADRRPVGGNAPTEAERRLATTDLTADRPVPPPPAAPTRPEPAAPDVVPAGPRPRSSVLATLGLIFGVAGAFFVLSGALAGYGIALGAIGVLLSVGAFSATRKRHVAGKLDALLGLLIGGAAVVVGILAFTGTFAWPNTDGDWVVRLREWLDSQFVDRF